MTYVRLNAHNLTHNTGARHPESLKKKAIVLRRRGHTYSEILQHIPVVKSTLSLWLAEVGLSKKQKQHITAKKLAAARRGGAVRKADRIERSKVIIEKARAEIGTLSKRELLLIGAALYWAEGDKQKEYNPSVRVGFINSDPRMIRLCLAWLHEVCGIANKDILISLTLHENHIHRVDEMVAYWSRYTSFSKSRFTSIYYKKDPSRQVQKTNTTQHKPHRHNTGSGYYGILKIRVRRSADLNRRIAGWVEGIVAGMGKRDL